MDKKISIIMGVFNDEKYVERSILSIIGQDYENWEFIICNDCSSDNSIEILKKYSRLDKRIIIIENEVNMGLAASLNNCLKYASGYYIGRQDADDTSIPNRFSLQVKYLQENPEIDILSTFANLVDDDFQVWGKRETKIDLTLIDWARGSQIIHACTLMKASALHEVGGYDPLALRVEDYDLWLRLLKRNKKISVLPKKLYNIHWTLSDYDRKKNADRIRELKYKIRGIRSLNMPYIAYIFVLKTVLTIIIPKFLLFYYHKRKMNSKYC